MPTELKTSWCSSLSKILLYSRKEPLSVSSGYALQGERFSLQLFYRSDSLQNRKMKVEVHSELTEFIRVRRVESVPVSFLGFEKPDNDVVAKSACMIPDRLRELEGGYAKIVIHQNRSLWLTVDIPRNIKAGKYTIALHLTVFSDPYENPGIPIAEASCGNAEHFETKKFCLEILPVALLPQRLKNTQWFHCDCLADYYHVPIFSEAHWKILASYMKNAATHGMNMILTPLFTPPLNTAFGKERPTVQLVGVRLKNGIYSYDFSRLERWIETAQSCGIQFFEFSHLFTQWGAEYPPKIVANKNGKMKKIFGWHIRSDSPEYTDFLSSFLPALKRFVEDKKLSEKVYFHCSDEPSVKHEKAYRRALGQMEKHLSGLKIFDALSTDKFHSPDFVSIPVPLETMLEKFIRTSVKERWTYYCCAPARKYPNRFIHMTSSRNKVMGLLMYYYELIGILHWGYNFYYTALSETKIDSYSCNTCDEVYPPGDPFLVYPDQNGKPEDSIRHEVFFEAVQDQRIFELLESFVPRKKVIELLLSWCHTSKLSMTCYPHGEKKMLEIRRKLYQYLKRYLKTHLSGKTTSLEKNNARKRKMCLF